MWRKPVDCIRTDDVVRPGLASLLHLPEIVLLVVVEIEALVGRAGEPLLKRHTNRAEVGAIILNTSVSAIQKTAASNPHLAASLERDTLEFRASKIDSVHEIPEKRDILLLQESKVVVVHIRSKVCMGHVGGDILQVIDNLVDRLQEV